MPADSLANPTDLGPKVAQLEHAVYQTMKPVWTDLAHVREGTGGFLDGTYLRPHPREWLDHTVITRETETGAEVARLNPNPRKPSPKLKARRLLARYENVASAIIQSTKAVLFREQPTRRVQDGKATEPSLLERWWDDVDGKGTHIDDAMLAWWDMAATFGHVALYVHQPSDGTATTAADDPAPVVRVYTPLDVLDWLTDADGKIISVKVLEAVTPATYGAVLSSQVRVIDETFSTVYDYKTGKAGQRIAHGMGRLPVVFLYAKRRALLTDIGESVLGDPKNYIDLYNLTSEVRELLRSQTFSFINLPLGTGADAMSVEQAQAMMGKQTGTMNVLFSGAAASILSGDPSNVQSYHDEISRIRREIYRETGVQWESDSKDAEAMGSLALKREEMTTRIAGYADECQQAEYGLVDCFYRATFGDLAEKTLRSDAVTIHYPERFAQTPFDDVLKQAQSAVSLGMPPIFLKELRKALVTKFEGMANLNTETLEAINQAIDSAEGDMTPAEQMKAKIEASAKKGTASGKAA